MTFSGMRDRPRLSIFSFLPKYVLLTFPLLIIGFALFFSASCDTEKKEIVTIQLNPAIKYQTITGWEATAQAGEDTDPRAFLKYKDQLFDMAVNDLGINRLRLELRSGVETSREMWQKYQESQGEDKRKLRYKIINDNDDPFQINWDGFQFEQFDTKVEKVILPMKKLLEASGEKLYLNLNYVNFSTSNPLHKVFPEEYAELIQAAFLHLHNKYKWVPDAVEVILEPDNSGFSGLQMGKALVATATRLEAEGFHPAFIAPSTTSMANTIPWFNEMMKVPEVLHYLKEISYHRYRGVSEANLQTIANLAVQHKLNTAMLEHIGSTYQDLHQDLKVGRNSAWQQYTLAYPAPSDNGGHYYRIRKEDKDHPEIIMGSRTKFLRQYFKFIRRGAVRIRAFTRDAEFDPLAFINKDGNYVVVVKAERGGSIAIQGLPSGKYRSKYTTNDEYDVDLPDVEIRSGQRVKARIPKKGVITVYGKT
jgi:hypothetical protein